MDDLRVPFIERLFIGAIGTLITLFIGAGFLGVRRLLWDGNGAVAPALVTGALIGGGIGMVGALVYIITGWRFWGRIDARSIGMGMIYGIILYGGYLLIPTVTNGADRLSAFARGAIDGIFLGIAFGAAVSVIGRRRLEWTRPDLVRFTVLFLVVLSIVGIVAIIDRWGGMWDTFSGIIGVVLFIGVGIAAARMKT